MEMGSRFSKCADKFRADKRSIKVIFVDETLIKINGQDHWLWIAYEPNIHSCLLFHLSKERTIFMCYQFFKEIRSRYGNKLIYIDGAHWYNNACKWLRLKHILYETPLKNLMERFIQEIKDRTECFHDHFSCDKKECATNHVNNWLKMFIPYLPMRADKVRFLKFLNNYCLRALRSIKKLL
jgi:putative transposase